MLDNEQDIEELLARPDMADVREELESAAFLGSTHGRRATYNRGCHGPLCKMRHREHGREQNKRKAFRQGRQYQASIHRDDSRKAELLLILEWHLNEMALQQYRNELRKMGIKASRTPQPGQIAWPDGRVTGEPVPKLA